MVFPVAAVSPIPASRSDLVLHHLLRVFDLIENFDAEFKLVVVLFVLKKVRTTWMLEPKVSKNQYS